MRDGKPLFPRIEVGGTKIRVSRASNASEGWKCAKIKCPNCGIRNTHSWNNDKNLKKCGCGFNQCDIIVMVRFDGQEWKEVDHE